VGSRSLGRGHGSARTRVLGHRGGSAQSWEGRGRARRGDAQLTVALLPVGKERGDDDAPLLAGAHAQQPLVHALDQPPGAHVGVVGAVLAVAGGEE